MAFFELDSDITIGSFQFSGVNEVRVERSLKSYADRAYIKVPSICRIIKGKRSSPIVLITANQFNDGDPVTINLGYNGQMNQVFKGFVKRRDMGMPLMVECEGYSYQMRENVSVNAHFATTSVKKLLALITASCPDITVVVKDDLAFSDITCNEANGADICDKIKELSQGVLSVFFINPTTLWCGLTYTPYIENTDPFDLGQVSYRLGYNVVKDNSLKERTVENDKVQVIINTIYATGQKITTSSQTKYQGRKEKLMSNNMPKLTDLQSVANEKQYQMNYAGYEGSINAFLEPFCQPGYKANIVDDRYPERNGVFMVEGTDITYGIRGARIKVDIGPKIGFNPNFQ